MNRNLEKTLAKLTILSTLLFGGCNLDFSNLSSTKDKDTTTPYVGRSTEKLREGYSGLENFNVNYLDHPRHRLREDTVYNKLIFTNNQPATLEIIKKFNGLYRSRVKEDKDAILLEDGIAYRIWFYGELPDTNIRYLNVSEVTSPVVLLDDGIILANFINPKVYSRDNPTRTLRQTTPLSNYSPLIIKRTDDGIYYRGVWLENQRRELKDQYDLFSLLKNNSKLDIVIGEGYWKKEDAWRYMKHNPEAYKAVSSKMKKISNF